MTTGRINQVATLRIETAPPPCPAAKAGRGRGEPSCAYERRNADGPGGPPTGNPEHPKARADTVGRGDPQRGTQSRTHGGSRAVDRATRSERRARGPATSYEPTELSAGAGMSARAHRTAGGGTRARRPPCIETEQKERILRRFAESKHRRARKKMPTHDLSHATQSCGASRSSQSRPRARTKT